MRLKEIEARLAAIKTDLETRGAQLTAEDITKYETEVTQLQEERKGLEEAAEKRTKLLNSLATGNGLVDSEGNPAAPTVLRSFGNLDGSNQDAQQADGDKFATMAYRKAFMQYVCRGAAIPEIGRAHV